MRRFSKIGVAIIESLGDNERKTGREIHETTLYYLSLQVKFLENEYHEVSNTYQFLDVLEKIVHTAVNEDKFYFLHFEIHGNENGVVLKEGQQVDWSIILPYLRSLNILYSNNLSVYLAICKGNSIIRFVNHLERAPFSLIFGSFQNVKNLDILIMFEEFYTEFFKKFSNYDAYQMIINLGLANNFVMITSQYIIDYLLKLEANNNDEQKLLDAIDESLIPLGDLSPNIDVIVKKIRNDVVNLYKNYKIDKDFFLIKDL